MLENTCIVSLTGFGSDPFSVPNPDIAGFQPYLMYSLVFLESIIRHVR